MDDPRNVAATPQARYLTNDGFTCGYCTSDMPAGTNYVPVGPDSMCEDCFLGALKPQFLACLQSQASYPVTWGTLALDMADFPTFTPEEHAQWKSAVYEYATPQLYRLYCRHEYYYENGIKKYPDDQTAKVRVALAQKRGKKTGVDDLFVNRLEPTLPVGTDQTLTCSQCDKAWCARCGMKRPPALIVDFQNHLCTPPQPDLSEYDKLGTRGRDWQVCPNAACLRPATQDGGCNAMVCSCMTHYCYCCGQRAHHDGDHWRAANSDCPRWGLPGSADAWQEPPLVRVVPDDIRQKLEDLRARAAQPKYRDSPKATMLLNDRMAFYNILGDVRARREEHTFEGQYMGTVALGEAFDGLLLRYADALKVEKFWLDDAPRAGESVRYSHPEELMQPSLWDPTQMLWMAVKFSDEITWKGYEQTALTDGAKDYEDNYPATFDLYPGLKDLFVRTQNLFPAEMKIWERARTMYQQQHPDEDPDWFRGPLTRTNQEAVNYEQRDAAVARPYIPYRG